MPGRVIPLLSLALALLMPSALANGISTFKVGEIQRNGLTRKQAQQLLMVALRHERYKVGMPGVFIDGDLADERGNPPHAGYFDFSLGYDSPKAGATEYMGLFSVSTSTGDIWETNTCKRFSFPRLRQLQSAIMERTGKTMADEEIQRRGLGCGD